MSTSPDRPVSHAGGEGGTPRPRNTSSSGSRPAGSGNGNRSGSKRRRKKTPPVVNGVLSVFGWIFKILGTLLLIGIVTGCFAACYGMVYIQTVIMPEAEKLDLESFVLNESSTIYYMDENGNPVEWFTLDGEQNRVILDADEIPEVFFNVAMAAEDKRFLTHKGVDWIRTGAAVIYMFTGRDIQGGSTITQQVIKNYTQENEVTVKRKVLEIFRALATENRYSKEQIMAMYLNYIFLGDKQYGIAAASEYYFGKDVSEITLAEAASIIAITNNPSLYGPYSTVETHDSETGEVLTGLERNKRRQETILWVMCYDPDIAMITEEEYKAAIAQPLNFVRGMEAEEEEIDLSSVNPWYVDEVIAEAVKYFKSQGYTSKAANDLVYGGGLHIYTFFDPRVQACVDEIYTNLDNLPYTSKDGQQLQSSITIVDNSTGHVVAMAGQMGIKTGNRWWNFSTDSTRQPGSSIKPLAAYSPAIELGLVTPYTIIDDSPFQMLNGKPWPRNDNGRYKGLVTVLEGIHGSTNTVAVKLINDYVTPEQSFRFLEERYGITTLVDNEERNGRVVDDHGASQLGLGGLTDGLRPYEMAAAYATFPRGGLYTAPTVILRVENRDHQVIWNNEPVNTPVISETTAHYMNILLTSARQGTGSAAVFNGMHIAGKTGTTTDNYDRWFAGYTPYYTAVVWTGYERNAKILGTNGNPAARLWGKVMALVHEGLEDKPFFSVSNLTSATICLDCGQLANDTCGADIRGSRAARYSFVEGTQPRAYCTCHVPITICTESPIIGSDGMAIAGAYHEAGEFCPEESVKTVYVVSRFRDPELCGGLNIEDRYYMVSFYEELRAAETAACTVHTTAAVDPNDPNAPFDPNDPNYPYDPNDPNNPGVTDPNQPPDWLFPPDPGTTDPGTTDPGGGYLPPTSTQQPEDPVTTDPPQTGGEPVMPNTPVDTPPPDDYVPVTQ